MDYHQLDLIGNGCMCLEIVDVIIIFQENPRIYLSNSTPRFHYIQRFSKDPKIHHFFFYINFLLQWNQIHIYLIFSKEKLELDFAQRQSI